MTAERRPHVLLPDPPTVKSARDRLQKMLFDEENADLFFGWEDGTKISAHKNIVSPVAPYFKLVQKSLSFLEKEIHFRVYGTSGSDEHEAKKRKVEFRSTNETTVSNEEHTPDAMR